MTNVLFTFDPTQPGVVANSDGFTVHGGAHYAVTFWFQPFGQHCGFAGCDGFYEIGLGSVGCSTPGFSVLGSSLPVNFSQVDVNANSFVPYGFPVYVTVATPSSNYDGNLTFVLQYVYGS